MTDTVQHYLCNNPLPVMLVGVDKHHEGESASVNPIYWRCNWVTRSQENGCADYRCLDGLTVEVNGLFGWHKQNNYSCSELDNNGQHARCNADGTSLADDISEPPGVDKPDEPLKVGDWVEILRNRANCADVKRGELLMVETVLNDTFGTAGDVTWWFERSQEGIEFRRVPPPSEQAECNTCGIGSRLPSGVCDHCNQPVSDDANPPACKSCRVPWRYHLGPESQCAGLNDRIAELERERDELKSQLAQATRDRDEYHDDLCDARQKIVTAEADRQYVCDALGITKKECGWQLEPADVIEPIHETFRQAVDALADQINELDSQAQDRAQARDKLEVVTRERDELRQQLATVQAEAAAMREAFSRRVTFGCNFWKGANDFYIRFNDAQKARDCEHAIGSFLQGTAGRELLDELRRKDAEIQSLKGRQRYLIEASCRYKRKARTAKRDLIEARAKLDSRRWGRVAAELSAILGKPNDAEVGHSDASIGTHDTSDAKRRCVIGEHNEVPFEIGIETTRWEFDNGDYVMIEKNTSGYFLSGRVGGKDVHDGDHEDFYFPDTDSLLEFLEKHGLLSVLTKKGDAP